jgi:hypothetical protein
LRLDVYAIHAGCRILDSALLLITGRTKSQQPKEMS